MGMLRFSRFDIKFKQIMAVGILFGSFLLYTITAAEIHKEMGSRFKLYLGLCGGQFFERSGEPIIGSGKPGSVPSYIGKFMVFWGPIGIGTAVQEHNTFMDYRRGEFQIGDTVYSWNVSRRELFSYFPIAVRWIAYSKPLGYGNLSLYSYLKASLWSRGKREYWVGPSWGVDPMGPRRGKIHCCISSWPSSYFDLGVCLSLNPLRFIPMEVRLGMSKVRYLLPTPPEPYQERVPSGYENAVLPYISLFLSFEADYSIKKE